MPSMHLSRVTRQSAHRGPAPWPATAGNATGLARVSSTVMAPLCPPSSPDIDTVTASRSFPCRIALRYRPKISKTAPKQAKYAGFPCDDGVRHIGCSNAAGGSKTAICRTLWAFCKETDELKWDDRYV